MLKGKMKLTARAQLSRAVDEETFTRCSIECCLCDRRERERDIDPTVFVNRLFAAGWRYGTSDSFAVEGAICPVCMKIPDAERPERCETPADYCDCD